MSQQYQAPEGLRLSIASPCSAEWNTMQGDEQVRFCGQCEKNVYNLSSMSALQAAALIAEKEGRLCVRYFQRDDGTVLTQDCPVGLHTLHQKRIYRFKKAGIAAAITLITVAGVFSVFNPADAESQANNPHPDIKGQYLTGGIRPYPKDVMGDVAEPLQPAHPSNIQQPIMGEAVAPPIQGNLIIDPPKTPADKQSPDNQPLMGKPMAKPDDNIDKAEKLGRIAR